jgi:hypothetical protein
MFTDPSYLRSIRDGILSGSIEVNNSNALPDGLSGVFDRELFPSTLALRERRELLLFFVPFAVAQKEISVDFATDVLAKTWMKDPAEGEANYQAVYDQVNRFIQHHSKRFVSAGEGKYRLYHERFRVYILQKVTGLDIRTFNDQIISLCEKALKEKSGNEKEIYALEFLSTHLYINAMQDKEQGAKLKSLAFSQTYWERQIKASKSFEWSKRMLNEMMAWASKFDEEEVIECALQKVDLHHQEQNDAPGIVQLVADGEIETALERIQKFGGEDLKHKEREFRLIIVLILDNLFVSNKAELDIKKRILPLSNRLSEFSLNFFWPDTVDCYTIFKVSFELHKLGFLSDFLLITNFEINFDWIQETNDLSNDEINYLISISNNSIFPMNAINICCFVSTLLFRYKNFEKSKNQIEYALKVANSLPKLAKEQAYFIICKQLIFQNKRKFFIKLLSEITFEYRKHELIKWFIAQLSITSSKKRTNYFIYLIKDEVFKSKLNRFISIQAKEKGLIKRVMNTEMLEVSSFDKIKITSCFLTFNQKYFTNIEFEFTLTSMIIKINESRGDPKIKAKSLLLCISALRGKLKKNDSIEYLYKLIKDIEKIKFSDWKNEIFNNVSAEMLKQKKYSEAIVVIIKSLTKNPNDYEDFSNQKEGFLISEPLLLMEVAEVFIKYSNYNATLILLKYIKSANIQTLVFYRMVDDLFNKNQIKAVKELLNKTTYLVWKKYIACKLMLNYLKNNNLANATEIYEGMLGDFVNYNFDFKDENLALLQEQVSVMINDMVRGQEEPLLFHTFSISQIFKRVIYSFKEISILDKNEIMFRLYSVRNDYLLNEHLIQMVSLNQLFFSNISQKKLNRYNRTLNIQWAIDIKNQLPS